MQNLVTENIILQRFSRVIFKLYDHGEYCRIATVEGIESNNPIASRYEFERSLERLIKEFNFVHITDQHFYLNMQLVGSFRKCKVNGKLVCLVTPLDRVNDLILDYKWFTKLQKLSRP